MNGTKLVQFSRPNCQECQDVEAPSPPNRGINGTWVKELNSPYSQECQDVKAPTPPYRGTDGTWGEKFKGPHGDEYQVGNIEVNQKMVQKNILDFFELAPKSGINNFI